MPANAGLSSKGWSRIARILGLVRGHPEALRRRRTRRSSREAEGRRSISSSSNNVLNPQCYGILRYMRCASTSRHVHQRMTPNGGARHNMPHLCAYEVLMDMSIMGSNFTAKMRDSHIELPGFAGRLFTSQRGWRVFWYAGLGCCLWLFGGHGPAIPGPKPPLTSRTKGW